MSNRYQIQIGRDARIYHSATCVSNDLAEIIDGLSRHGFGGAVVGDSWSEDGTDEYDNVETVAVTDTVTGKVMDWDELNEIAEQGDQQKLET